MKRGRPTKYTAALAKRICDLLSTGRTLRSICREDGFPDESAVRQWALENREGFYPQYVRARDLGLDAMADETIDVADESSKDVNRSRLRFDARRWYLSKLAPKRYGETPATDEKEADEMMKELADAIRNSPHE